MKNYLQLKILLLVFAFTVLFSQIVFSQTAEELTQSSKLEREAIKNYREKKFVKLLDNIEKAKKLRPNHSRLIYISAIAFALNKKDEEALYQLERLARMGLFYQIEKNKDLLSLQKNEKFAQIQNLFSKNNEPINKSSKVFELQKKDLVTESVAFDSKTNRYFVSSVHQGKILTIDKDKNTTEFSSSNDGLWSVLGLKVDEKRRILWACSTAFPQFNKFNKKDEGKSAIFKYDLDSGKLLQKYSLSENGKKFAIGDLVVNKNGDVYATDSVSPNIYKIDAKKDKLEVFLTSKNFSSLQGLTFNKKRNKLFVADYSRGIFVINLKSKLYKQLTPAKDLTVLGIDGLYYYKGNLIAIQNGIRPHRVVKLFIDKKQTKIIRFETLEANHPNFEEPTLGMILGNEFYYVANSQWNLFGRDGKLQKDKLKNPVILKLKL